ncbi:MAG: pseudaminic acid cytidylyltransferase [Cytophagales bacterium]|uniref:pseudaminic acid cytidylyltransferase n=1 Tax=Cyclobacterium marinum TaxID=104 RepID=UPI0030D74996|nr:pseudaminic acid cytidylyltransferase [Cytophagales bacterium]|tara:strand:+ start:6524 stop:7222 length:699 start_codon:yes stop_codon:yes gene_type:complete
MSKYLCIIPARGGSKRIPKKNTKKFLGEPIISYSINIAIESGLFTEIMVSTEDHEIAEIALQLGAKVPFFRSLKNAGDFSTTVDVLLEVIHSYEIIGKTFDYICCIYPTAPFISNEKLKLGLEKLKFENRSTIFPVISFSYPIWRGLRETKSNTVEFVWPKYVHTRSQDLEYIYHDAGQWYWCNVFDLKREKNIFTRNSSVIKLQPNEVQDIDNITDWEIAELKYKCLKGLI